MSRPRTYIGPFGRILPVLDGSEPEREYLPCDETRTNMTTFSLPPPDRLQFGSDASPGFTDPTRYNTTTQSSRTDEPTNAIYKEISRQAHHEHLPSLRHILTPTSQSSIAQYPPQQSPSHVQQRSTFFSDHRGMVPDLHIRHPWYSPYQASFPQSQLPTQAQLVENLNPQRDDYQSSLSTQHFPSSYASLSQGPVQLPYPSQPQQIAVPNVLLPQQLLPVDQPQQPQILPVNSPVQYYPDHRGSHDTVLNPGSGPEQGEASIANHVKPLPRVTGEGDIPGEGPSWFYEDGTSCKKMIDGEPVNAQWGVTKAGKPRKRLGIACMTCREKKIKCDPADPKCEQCEKFGRECRFTTAFLRNQHSTSESPSYESQARTPPTKIKSEPNTRRILPSLTSASSMEDINVLPRLKRRISSPEISHAKSPLAADPILSVYKLPAVKKQRSSLSSPILPKENYEVRSSKSRGMIASSCPSHVRPWKDLSHAIHTYSCDWSDDPHEIDARATSYYLGMHRNICSDPLRASTVAHNVRAAIDHAWQFLQLVHLIDKSSLKRSEHDSTKRTQKRPLESGWSTPFIGYAILTAVDAISAGGSVETYEEMMTVMHQSLVVVDRLSQLWASAGGQSRLIRQRIAALEECVESKHSMDKSAWKCTHALDPSLGQGHDVFYNSHDVKGMKLFEYLGIKVREDEVLLVVGKMDYSEMPKGDMSQQYS